MYGDVSPLLKPIVVTTRNYIGCIFFQNIKDTFKHTAGCLHDLYKIIQSNHYPPDTLRIMINEGSILNEFPCLS